VWGGRLGGWLGLGVCGGMGEAYAVVEAEERVVAEDVEKGVEHAFRAIGGTSLEADLLMVSKLFCWEGGGAAIEDHTLTTYHVSFI